MTSLTFLLLHRNVYLEIPMSDLVLYNANVITMDPVCPKAEMVIIKNGRITGVSDNTAIRELKDGKAEVMDCEGKTVIPGFIDAHCHLAAFAEGLVSIDLSPQEGTRSLADMCGKIRTFCADRPRDTWIRGKGYNEFYLKEKCHPNRHDLDKAAPLHPVKLTHRSGHAHVLNSLGLKIVGITAESGDPPDGLIDRDLETGEPTGILFGMGNYLAKKIPAFDDDEMKQGVRLANEELLSMGITSIQDATSHNDIRCWNMFQQWKSEGIFKSGVTMMLGMKGFDEYKRQRYQPFCDESGLRISGVKIIIHEITGDLEPSQKRLNEMVFEIHRAGFQAVLHAVEERTIEVACDAIEYTLKQLPRQDHRHRIEHCSVCPPALAKRIADLGIMVVTQPAFLYHGGDRYLKTVPPEQLKDLYPIRRLIINNIKVAASSDFPIVKPNPFIGIYAAVTRMSENGKPVLPEEDIERLEALRMYTQMAAAASFQEQVRGSIAVGKAADLIVLNNDPTRVSADEIKSIKVEMTIIDGEIAYKSKMLVNNKCIKHRA
jgi:predicted amidohydrolase YtcJ